MNVFFMAFGAITGMSIRYYLSEKYNLLSFYQIITITTLINIASCFLIGIFIARDFESIASSIFSQSFLSAFSTYSTFNYELLKTINISIIKGFISLITTCLLSLLFFYFGLII